MLKHKEYNLTNQAVFIFISKFIQILFQFLVPIILIRILSQTDYGIYQKVLFFIALAIPLFKFHFTESLYYFSLITYLLYTFSYFKVFGTDKIFKQLKLK